MAMLADKRGRRNIGQRKLKHETQQEFRGREVPSHLVRLCLVIDLIIPITVMLTDYQVKGRRSGHLVMAGQGSKEKLKGMENLIS